VGVGGARHRVGLIIDPILNSRAVATQFLEKRDDLRRLLFAQNRQFERQQFATPAQTVVAPLGGQNDDDDYQ